jgi:hypothetical protein
MCKRDFSDHAAIAKFSKQNPSFPPFLWLMTMNPNSVTTLKHEPVAQTSKACTIDFLSSVPGLAQFASRTCVGQIIGDIT